MQRQPPPGRTPGSTARSSRIPPRHSAARSHEQNDAYMAEMEKGFRALGMDMSDVGAASNNIVQSASAQGRGGSVVGGGGGWAYETPSLTGAGWYKGPQDPQGAVYDQSDRPHMCLSMHPQGDTVVVASSDHALYEVDLRRGRKGRQLYNKRFGHTEWVTTCSYLPDGRVLSGGMDSKLCLWDAKGVKCTDLEGHAGSISEVQAGADSATVVSAAYDKTVRCWSVGGARPREACCLSGHRAPVLCLAWAKDGALASGDRGGSVMIWDAGAGKAARALKDVHSGHITALAWIPAGSGTGSELGDSGGSLLVSGGQDGMVRMWDARSKGCVAEAGLHVRGGGSGAVGGIKYSPATAVVVTAGADRVIQVSDPRMSFAELHTFTEHKDFIYSMEVAQNLVFSGGGDGLLLVHNLANGKVLYGLGANQHAVRGIGVSPTHLVATGDDGNTLVYDMQ